MKFTDLKKGDTMKSKKIIVVNGPNLNLLGTREVQLYGQETLEQINDKIKKVANGFSLEFFQSNSEGEIIDFIHKNRDAAGLLINPGAYTHTSIAIRDAISGVKIPAVEVHLSNIHSREEFRTKSMISPVCIGQISGFGSYSYILGINGLVEHINKMESK